MVREFQFRFGIIRAVRFIRQLFPVIIFFIAPIFRILECCSQNDRKPFSRFTFKFRFKSTHMRFTDIHRFCNATAHQPVYSVFDMRLEIRSANCRTAFRNHVIAANFKTQRRFIQEIRVRQHARINAVKFHQLRSTNKTAKTHIAPKTRVRRIIANKAAPSPRDIAIFSSFNRQRCCRLYKFSTMNIIASQQCGNLATYREIFDEVIRNIARNIHRNTRKVPMARRIAAIRVVSRIKSQTEVRLQAVAQITGNNFWN